MAAKPNAEIIFQTLVRIIERRYEVKIEYILKNRQLI